mgnify:FL=1
MNRLKSLFLAVILCALSFFQSYAGDIKTSNDLLNEIASSSNKQVVIVNFYASWCPPCREEIKDLIKVREQFSANDLRIIAVNLDDEASTMQAFNKKAGINYETWHDFQGNISSFFNFQSIPFNIVYSKAGKAIYAKPGAIPLQRLTDLIEYGLTK